MTKEKLQRPTLIDPFMIPEISPERPYSPAEGTVAWCSSIDGMIVLEVFSRTDGSFGFRYQSWGAWRAAGDKVQGHSWWKCEAADAYFVDRFDTTREIAEKHAQSKDVELDSMWRFVV
jgi:hypothetical protein